MHHFAYTPRSLTIALALAACELPTKLGNLSGTDTDEQAGTTLDATDGETSAGTTAATTDNVSDTWLTSTSMFDPSETTAGPIPETTDGPVPIDCLELGEADCEASGCMAYYGSAYEFPGCTSGLLFLGCSDPKDCEHDQHTFCREGTDEAYELIETTCEPPGYVQCEPPGVAFCDSCESLTEAECLAEPAECQPIYGAPHIETNGSVCADYTDMQFLICQANGGACPPFVPVVCDPDNPEQPYDSPSGCIPAGWVECGERGVSGCD
ncbi:hypothetical protein SAMN02745121_04331 [Nannocystis exedens]|uniref:Uncharacterized protein n=1 Tax=Nannocystis exedens TaxID=54 RepID=A0A1I2ARP2_9BACT|nr:hypothetical protein [Nannocystis exedens]PCC74228.1 hypothetical protein NAEX_07317 [Nannocystis exedens]SFE46516.1 hypothetical protein SAMN02745121_04331 [Nannocystis exedens]